MRMSKGGTHDERGAAMVELALMMPFLMLLVTGVINIGDGLNASITVIGGARDGARLGAKGAATDAQINALVVTDLSRLRYPIKASDITVTRNVVSGQPSLRVQACVDHQLLVRYPLLPVPNPLRICSATTMPIVGTG